jgi:hypothetical protein
VHIFTRDQLAGELASGGFELVEHGTVADADAATSYGCAVARAV